MNADTPIAVDPKRLAEHLADAVERIVRQRLAEAIPKVALSITETAHALSIGRTTAYELVAAGDLPSVTIGGRKVVPVARLQEWVLAQEDNAGE